MNTFIQVLLGMTILQCSFMSPYTNSQIYSLVEYLSTGLPVYTPIRTLVAHQSGLTDRSKPIQFSACTADPANVELVSQHQWVMPRS